MAGTEAAASPSDDGAESVKTIFDSAPFTNPRNAGFGAQAGGGAPSSPTDSESGSVSTVILPLPPSAGAVGAPGDAIARRERSRAWAAAIKGERAVLDVMMDLTRRVSQATCLLETAVSTLDPAMVGSSADTMQLIDDLHGLCPQNNLWHWQKDRFYQIKTACQLAALAMQQLSAASTLTKAMEARLHC